MLSARQIEHAYDDDTVLHDIDLTVHEGEILCLLGPSGCGKTTLLRVIAGLEPGYRGTVTVAGNNMQGVAVHRRGFGLMFQDFALFPHMNVSDNIVFGLKMQGIGHKERQKRADEMLKIVGLEGFGERDVTQLSGGEKQRVALARSLAPEPRLLMLDEPLGSLDASLREQLMIELRQIIKSVGLTTVYVTHDQQEAYAVADKVAIMNAGRIEQMDTPEQLYHQPRTPFVARFLGLTNLVSVDVLPDTLRQAISDSQIEKNDIVLLHPDGIQVAESEAGENMLSGEVHERVFQGGRYRLRVHITDSDTLTFYVDSDTHAPDTGDTIQMQIDPVCVIPLQSAE
jgi:ABC-type Fe3+/spermidine/putrescine transport system ATPase subunit